MILIFGCQILQTIDIHYITPVLWEKSWDGATGIWTHDIPSLPHTCSYELFCAVTWAASIRVWNGQRHQCFLPVHPFISAFFCYQRNEPILMQFGTHHLPGTDQLRGEERRSVVSGEGHMRLKLDLEAQWRYDSGPHRVESLFYLNFCYRYVDHSSPTWTK